MRGVLVAALAMALLPLVLILVVTLQRGLPALSWRFVVSTAVPPSVEGGGYLNGLIGTAYMVGIATLVSVPLGILAAVYLVEYGKGRLAAAVRFFTDVMTGVPSVFVGLFVYSLLVRQIGFGTLVGGLALAILMLPIVVRSSEEILKLVPGELRGASVGLGARRWQTVIYVVLPAAGPGLVTGAMLAVARAAGETAPLLLTAFGAFQIVLRLQGLPQSALPLLIFREARSAFPAAQARAWAGALELMALVLVLTIAARVISSRARRRRS
jgi:phosphate transport system permease protein